MRVVRPGRELSMPEARVVSELAQLRRNRSGSSPGAL